MPQYVSPLSRRLQSNAVLYGAAIALRIVISSFPAVADYLAHRVELVTPLTSFKRCKTDLATKSLSENQLKFFLLQ